VSDCPERELIPALPHFLFQASHQRANVAWPDFREDELAQLRERVTLEASFIVIGASNLALSSVLNPALDVAIDRHGPKRRRAHFHRGFHATLEGL
jgi:hypothetical protein